MKNDERLIRLEENAYFQEEKIRELDSQILAQQTRLDQLERQLEGLKTAFMHLRDVVQGNQRITQADEQPPHYQQERW